MTGRKLRALIVVRLSRVTDETTSPERQRQKCEELCQQRDYDVVGVAEDLDVSAGATSPFERPSLKGWIGDGKDDPGRVNEFDVIVFYRVDRIARRLFDLADLIKWSQQRHVTLVSATESHFDLTSEFGDIIALLIAKVAEMELRAISERNSSAFRHNIKEGKWRGGVPPWGYLPRQDDTGTWKLVQDPVQVAVIREVVDRVLSGEPMRAIAHSLTENGVLTAKDRFAQVQGREVKSYEWYSAPLKRSLSSKTLLGYAITREPLRDAQGRIEKGKNGKNAFGPEDIVRNEDGSPVIRAEPILTREVFDRVQAEIKSRENRKEPTKRSSGLLLRVIYCGVCGKPAYRLKGGPGRNPRYRCASAQNKSQCENRSIPLEAADSLVSKNLLGLLGTSEHQKREWDSGSDNSAELAEINETLTDLTGLLGSGIYRAGTPQRVRLNERISSLAARQAELSTDVAKPPGWVWRPTGETFADWWNRQDVTAQNVWLRQMNIRLDFNMLTGEQHLDLGSLSELLEGLEAKGVAAEMQRTIAGMKSAGVAGITVHPDGTFDITPQDQA